MTDPVLAHVPAFSDLLNDGVSNLVVLDFDGVINPFASRFNINQKRFYRPNHLVHIKSPWSGNEQYPVKWSDDLMSDLSGIMGDPGTVLVDGLETACCQASQSHGIGDAPPPVLARLRQGCLLPSEPGR